MKLRFIMNDFRFQKVRSFFFFNAKQPCLKIVYSFFGFSKVGLGNARI